jgi:hypothetical protein
MPRGGSVAHSINTLCMCLSRSLESGLRCAIPTERRSRAVSKTNGAFIYTVSSFPRCQPR